MTCVMSMLESLQRPIVILADPHRFFVCYRDVACTIYPVVADTHKFSTTLFLMLSNRGRHNRDNMEIDPTKPYGVSLPWLSLMFAVFASGSQSSDRPAKERELTSQVYSELPPLSHDWAPN